MTKQGIEILKIHEGFKQHFYKCTANKKTIGYGLNIESPHIYRRLGTEKIIAWIIDGITREEAEKQLLIEVEMIEKSLRNLDFFNDLTDARKDVIVNMCYQMGLGVLSKFQKFTQYVMAGDYEKASLEMKYSDGSNTEKGFSKWYHDSEDRCISLSVIMRKGNYRG